MKINNLKINGFGKIKNKEINLNDGINVIYGKNETGKSTILKYIISMFYGLSKNKNGGKVPEIEKYEPWNSEDFSGKIIYELDNKNVYEVYRDFKKKNPKVFNENLEDISKEFNIDKTKGIEFFKDQTGIEEEIFTTSIITKQAEVKLDEKEQNTLIQKISNILGTGEDTISYTSIVNKLKKKLNDEVGTQNTKERPINIVESKIEELSIKKNELQKYQSNKFNIDEQSNIIKEEIEELNKELEILRNVNIKKEKLKETESRIKINIELLNNTQNEIDLLNKEKKKSKAKENKIINNMQLVILFILTIICIVLSCIISNIFVKTAIILAIGIYIVYIITNVRKKAKINKEIKSKLIEIEEKIKILEQNTEKQKNELESIKKEYDEAIITLKKESGIENLENLLELIDIKQRKVNDKNINLHTLKIDNDNIIPKLESLVNIEEELENLKDEKIELEQKRNNIKRTLEYFEIAYNKMKEQITPKFTNELSNAMEKISNEKYKNVRINTKGEIIVETKSGEYVNAENLSIGTIDQLYLSLRLATIKQITNENMPIILDEAFAYYDDNRLENILKYLSKEYYNKQIILFTCTNREIDILNRIGISYNKIEL